MKTFLVIVAVLAFSVDAQNEKPEESDLWNNELMKVKIKHLGESITLNCTDGSTASIRPIHWLLNDVTILRPDSTNSNPMMLDGGRKLRIMDIQRSQFGNYYCYAEVVRGGITNETYFGIMLYLERPSLWEMYRMNVIIGISATAVGLVLCVLMCLVYHYRWRPDDSYDDVSPYTGRQVTSYGNKAYSGEMGDGGEKNYDNYPTVVPLDDFPEPSATKM